MSQLRNARGARRLEALGLELEQMVQNTTETGDKSSGRNMLPNTTTTLEEQPMTSQTHSTATHETHASAAPHGQSVHEQQIKTLNLLSDEMQVLRSEMHARWEKEDHVVTQVRKGATIAAVTVGSLGASYGIYRAGKALFGLFRAAPMPTA